MTSDYRVAAEVLRQSLHRRAPSRRTPKQETPVKASRILGPTSRLDKGLLRARSALTADHSALETLDALVATPSFERLGPSLQYHILAQSLVVPVRDDEYISDLLILFQMSPDWPEGTVTHLVAQMERHAHRQTVRASLLKFASLKISTVLSPATQIDLITYLGGPSDGATTSNRDSLQAGWNRRREELLRALTRLPPKTGCGSRWRCCAVYRSSKSNGEFSSGGRRRRLVRDHFWQSSGCQRARLLYHIHSRCRSSNAG